MTANESSKLLFFMLSIPPPLLEEGPGEGWPSPQDAPEVPDGVLGERFQSDPSFAFHRDQDLSPWLEPDLFADLSGNNDLALGKSFNNWHMVYPAI